MKHWTPPSGKSWRWWSRDEPEDGLQGFVTKEARDRFSAGEPGPFRRVVAREGERTMRQNSEDLRKP
jgi:hypothetical protein